MKIKILDLITILWKIHLLHGDVQVDFDIPKEYEQIYKDSITKTGGWKGSSLIIDDPGYNPNPFNASMWQTVLSGRLGKSIK